MRIGLVKHINARPLTYGFEKSGEHSLLYENPSVLKDELLAGNLDLALISSIECLRNKDKLNFSLSTGVCATEKVRSILFFKNKVEDFHKIYVDFGSRSSVALLKVLIYRTYSFLPETLPEKPEVIQEMIHKTKGSHLLFGDNALVAKYDPNFYECIDLASWWHKLTGLGFCFAFWAYPKDSKISEDVFYISLEEGLKNLNEIIQKETRIEKNLLETYLKKELHYIVTSKDKMGFELFEKECKLLGLF